MLVGTHILSSGKDGGNAKGRAGCREDNVFGAKAQIVVCKLGRPVIEEGIFQTNTDQQTIQRGAALRGGAKVEAVCIRCVPVKSAGYPSRLAVNKCPVKGDAKSPGNVVIPFVSDAGGRKQGAAVDPTELITGNFQPGPETFTLDTENEHTDLVIAADLAAGETADAVLIKQSTTCLKPLIKQHAGAPMHADIAPGPAKDRCGRSVGRRLHCHIRSGGSTSVHDGAGCHSGRQNL